MGEKGEKRFMATPVRGSDEQDTVLIAQLLLRFTPKSSPAGAFGLAHI